MPLTSRRNVTKLLYAATAIFTIWLIHRLPGGPPLTVSRLSSRAIRVLYVYLVATCFAALVEGIASPPLTVGRNRRYWFLKLLVLALAFRLILRFDRQGLESGGPDTELPGFEGGRAIVARLGRRARDPEGAAH